MLERIARSTELKRGTMIVDGASLYEVESVEDDGAVWVSDCYADIQDNPDTFTRLSRAQLYRRRVQIVTERESAVV